MAETAYDFAVFGSTPLALLLAGLLAADHAKKVCLVGSPNSAFRLGRSVDLSVMPVTRPETWALLKATTPEVVRLLGRIHGRSGMQRIDPVFVAETQSGADALSHMRHTALGLGFAAERLPDGNPMGGVAHRLPDAILLRWTQLEPALGTWLEKCEVGRLSDEEARPTLRRDGGVRIEFGSSAVEAGVAVLADDTAILSHLDTLEREKTLVPQTCTAILTEPTRALAAPLLVYVDRGVTLLRGRSGGILAIGSGPPQQAIANIGGCLDGRGPLRRAGQRVFRSLRTADGAPLVGMPRGSKAIVVAGLGMAGAFLAPAIARALTGTAEGDEKAYFAAREGGRGNARATIAEFAVGGPPVEVAA
jgi:hypothetical protein